MEEVQAYRENGSFWFGY